MFHVYSIMYCTNRVHISQKKGVNTFFRFIYKMKASTNKCFFMKNNLQTAMYNSELIELGLKYYGVDERLLKEMVGCRNLCCNCSLYIGWIH